MIGHELKQIKLNVNWKTTVLFTVSLFVFAYNHSLIIEVLAFEWSDVVPFILTAVMGCFWVAHLSQVMISKLPQKAIQFFVFIGNNTLLILVWHFLSFKVVSLFFIVIKGLPMEQLACFPVIPGDSNSPVSYNTPWWWLYLLVGVGLPVLGCWVSKKKGV